MIATKNRVARYIGGGQVSIVSEDSPTCPDGGLLVAAEACGLCSGELMSWYMDRKVPHALGHEVAGVVIESQDERFPVGSRVFPHHHAPCLHCDFCRNGRFVHCEQWRRTRLRPGGMADRFGVEAENLNDTLLINDLRAVDGALIEPLACVVKSIRLAGPSESRAVIGLGVMGLMHMLMLDNPVGYDLNPARRDGAAKLGLNGRDPSDPTVVDTVFVCPGSQAAFDLALEMVQPGGTLVMFAPLGPGEDLKVPQAAYFKDVRIVNSYSCGPPDTRAAAEAIREGRIRAEMVCSDFISLDEIPEAYGRMKRTEILKPMVVWP